MLPLHVLWLSWLPGQEFEVARLQADGWDHDGQGSAMACDGESLLVGAPFGRSYAIDGSARLYERDPAAPSGWREAQRFEAPGYGLIDRFGHALDVDGDVLAVGAWKEDQARGAVHVFERRNRNAPFEPVARLEPAGTRLGQRFGYALDLDGERLLVGAPRGAPPPYFGWEGRAYLYEREAHTGTWQLVAELAHPDPLSHEPQFGHTLALRDDLAVLATNYLGFGVAFEVHVFARVHGTWEHRQVLTAIDVGGPAFQSFFGIALALEGDELYVVDPDNRAVHVFRRTRGGPREFEWATSIPAPPGEVLTVRENRMALSRGFSIAPGSVLLFERRNRSSLDWVQSAVLTGSNPPGTPAMGQSLVLDGEHVLVGDPALPAPTRPGVGGVRIFRVPPHLDAASRR